jgi:poly(hydroxyalkanoate) depolymerase family esterase
MPKRTTKLSWHHGFARIVGRMTKTISRAGSKALIKTLKNTSGVSKRKTPGAKSTSASQVNWISDVALGQAGARRYHLYKPSGVQRDERLPLIVMLHGCGQNAESFARCTKMNRLAASKHFFVLYPEQERIANPQNCWNWFDIRSGRAHREADSIEAAIRHACLLYPIDSERIVLAGLSAGASMAALMAVRHPERYRAIAMHSGVPPGLAHSSATAMIAMRGRKLIRAPILAGVQPPPLLVIHGRNDRVVAPINGIHAAQSWAAQWNAQASMPRTLQRGARYPTTITDYRIKGRLIASLCEVHELGHAWSGGAIGQAYSDAKGPDASSMIWTFAQKQFASSH